MGKNQDSKQIKSKAATKPKAKPAAKAASAAKAWPKKKKPRKSRKKPAVTVSVRILLGIMAVLLILTVLPHFTDRTANKKGDQLPSGRYSYGIDISYCQREIVWDSLMVLADGNGRTILSKTRAKDIRPLSFVFIKATEGKSLKDKYFRKHWENAGRKGLRRGAYHFFRSSKDPVQQAENFIKTVGPLSANDLPPVLDIETIHRGCSKEMLNACALKWLRTVETHYGRKPIVYSPDSFIKDILCDEIRNNYTIWVAHYRCSSPEWEDWHIWQFTDKALVYGVKDYTDMSVCRTSVLRNL